MEDKVNTFVLSSCNSNVELWFLNIILEPFIKSILHIIKDLSLIHNRVMDLNCIAKLLVIFNFFEIFVIEDLNDARSETRILKDLVDEMHSQVL